MISPGTNASRQVTKKCGKLAQPLIVTLAIEVSKHIKKICYLYHLMKEICKGHCESYSGHHIDTKFAYEICWCCDPDIGGLRALEV